MRSSLITGASALAIARAHNIHLEEKGPLERLGVSMMPQHRHDGARDIADYRRHHPNAGQHRLAHAMAERGRQGHESGGHRRGNPGGPTQYGHPGVPGIYSAEEVEQLYSVTGEKWEVIKTSLYDSAVYPAAGTQQLTFFALPIGQGVGFGGGTKTNSDTDMVSQGMLPAGIQFLVQSIEIRIQPTTPNVTAQMPAVFGAQAAMQVVNDPWIIGRSGFLRFEILSKPYLIEAPIGRFPSDSDFNVQAALADVSTAGSSFQSRVGFGKFTGDRYHLSPVDLRLAETMNFSITLNWPEGNQAITNPARIFVHLNGLEYRRSQ